jgi:hypothetical protein
MKKATGSELPAPVIVRRFLLQPDTVEPLLFLEGPPQAFSVRRGPDTVFRYVEFKPVKRARVRQETQTPQALFGAPKSKQTKAAGTLPGRCDSSSLIGN